jgi:hypothetical protein
MAQENLKKQLAKELEEKEAELQDLKSNTQKKLKVLETQVNI